jgi:hypothetical protein
MIKQKLETDLQSTTKDMIPARNETEAHAQDFMANDKLLVPILKAFIPTIHSVITHCTPL